MHHHPSPFHLFFGLATASLPFRRSACKHDWLCSAAYVRVRAGFDVPFVDAMCRHCFKFEAWECEAMSPEQSKHAR